MVFEPPQVPRMHALSRGVSRQGRDLALSSPESWLYLLHRAQGAEQAGNGLMHNSEYSF